MKICSTCHSRYDDAVKFCPHDGTVLPDPVDAFLGQRLMDQFDIRARCGQGAMGTVYQAHQVNMDRLVAIKILRQDLVQDRTVVKRFYREARAAARLSHPNIITVHLVAETDAGLPYIVMEYLDGTDLDTLCKAEAPLPVDRGVYLASQIAGALAEAHANNVIHRDLKPANIFVLAKERSPDLVKVLDFGIAKILERGGSDESRITKSGAIFGTPYYLSPEQATGAELDARADLYSLGVILYRLLTGHLPFESGSGLDVLVSHVKEPPPPPRLHNEEIPPALEGVILQALEKDKDRRFSSAEHMRQALEDVVAIPKAGLDRERSAPWARPGAGEDPGTSKRTVFGFSSGGGNQAVVGPVAPEQDPLVQVAQKAIAASGPKVASAELPSRESRPTVGIGAGSWANPETPPGGGAGAPAGLSPPLPASGGGERGSGYAPSTVAPAPPPVKAPIFDPDADRAPAPIPRPLPEDSAPGTEPRTPSASRVGSGPVQGSPDHPLDSSPSLVTGEHSAPSDATIALLRRAQDRGRWFTMSTVLLALAALGVGVFFVLRDQRARSARGGGAQSAPRADGGARGEPGARGPAGLEVRDAAVSRRSPPQQVGSALLNAVQRGYRLRLSCESRLEPRRDTALVLDLWRDGSGQPISDAIVALRHRRRGSRSRTVKARSTKVAGRYVFETRFMGSGRRRATLLVTLPGRYTLKVPFELPVLATRPRPTRRSMSGSPHRPMGSPHRPMGSPHRPMGDLPRLPPDDPMSMARPMTVLPMDPPDPPADPVDPD